MRIAFVSYEYPPFTPVGGIGTYVRHASTLLRAGGHEVEVFCGSTGDSGVSDLGGVRVHRVKSKANDFRDAVLEPFLERHRHSPFDVLEGPDYNADTVKITARHPELTHVIRLHSPNVLLASLWRDSCGTLSRIRITLGAWRRGSRRAFWQAGPDDDLEREVVRGADGIISPSEAMADWVVDTWGISRARITVVPCAYSIDQNLTSAPYPTVPRTVLYAGRLDRRKGVHVFVDAVPEILNRCPELNIRFVGRSAFCPVTKMDSLAYVQGKLKAYQHRIDYTGPLPVERMHEAYTSADICVIPSLWESYGLVCLESMLAGRAIVASNAGALPELLDRGNCGMLVPPRNSKALANAVVNLAMNPERCAAFGKRARERATTEYNSDKLMQMQLQCYERLCRQYGAVPGGHRE